MLKNVFRSESIKLKRSFLLYFHLVALIIFPVLLGLYYGNRKSAVTTTTMVTIFYELLAISSPIVISIVISLVFDREEKAGHCKNWLTIPGARGKIIQLQLFYYWVLYFIEIIGMSLLYFLILRFAFRVNGLSFIKIFLTSFIFAIFGFLQYEITQWLVLKFNVGGAMILGFFGLVFTCLSITNLFDFIWPVVPWAWQMRLMSFWLAGITSQVQSWTTMAMAVPVILTLGLPFLIIKSFNNWQN